MPTESIGDLLKRWRLSPGVSNFMITAPELDTFCLQASLFRAQGNSHYHVHEDAPDPLTRPLSAFEGCHLSGPHPFAEALWLAQQITAVEAALRGDLASLRSYLSSRATGFSVLDERKVLTSREPLGPRVEAAFRDRLERSRDELELLLAKENWGSGVNPCLYLEREHFTVWEQLVLEVLARPLGERLFIVGERLLPGDRMLRSALGPYSLTSRAALFSEDDDDEVLSSLSVLSREMPLRDALDAARALR